MLVLLRGLRYYTRLVSVSSLNDPGSLKGVGLLVLLIPTPGLSNEVRKALTATLGAVQ